MGLVLPGLALAGARSIPPPAKSGASAGVLTLYSEPGLKGRRTTFKSGSRDVERRGFVARSAESTGLWTLCEGGEVASRCQTVNGQVGELQLAPQIVRPGVNALALYDQPGLKGRRVVYSFPADRPAPFHARSARTWGGAWSLCERDFTHCRTLDGRAQVLDLVVEAVRPARDGAEARDATPEPPALPEVLPPRQPPELAPQPVHRSHPVERGAPPARLERVRRERALSRPAPRVVRRGGFIEVVESSRARRMETEPRWRADRPRPAAAVMRRRTPAPRLTHQVVDRHGRPTDKPHRQADRRVHMLWGGPDPYL